MSTRGTIAFIFYNETDGRYYLKTSQQFQHDMAPGMNNGSCLLDCFDEFYFGKRKHCKASVKPFKLIEKFAKKINVDLDVARYGWHMLRTKQDGTVIMDLRSPKKENGEPDYKNDFLATALHYSDWIYIMPLCDVSTLQIIGETDDFASYPYTVRGLPRNELQIFHYRNLEYTYNGCLKYLGNYLDREEDAKEKPSTRYEEIIIAYRDGDRDCLVVRTEDNKHVIFKEMK